MVQSPKVPSNYVSCVVPSYLLLTCIGDIVCPVVGTVGIEDEHLIVQPFRECEFLIEAVL